MAHIWSPSIAEDYNWLFSLCIEWLESPDSTYDKNRLHGFVQFHHCQIQVIIDEVRKNLAPLQHDSPWKTSTPSVFKKAAALAMAIKSNGIFSPFDESNDDHVIATNISTACLACDIAVALPFGWKIPKSDSSGELLSISNQPEYPSIHCQVEIREHFFLNHFTHQSLALLLESITYLNNDIRQICDSKVPSTCHPYFL